MSSGQKRSLLSLHSWHPFSIISFWLDSLSLVRAVSFFDEFNREAKAREARRSAAYLHESKGYCNAISTLTAWKVSFVTKEAPSHVVVRYSAAVVILSNQGAERM